MGAFEGIVFLWLQQCKSFFSLQLVIEPSSSTAFAAVLQAAFRERFAASESVGVILSGGNVDVSSVPWV